MSSIKIKKAKSKEDKEKIFRFRYEVMESTGTYQPLANYDKKKIEELIDQNSILVMSEENGSVTGTYRTYTLDQESFEYEKQCELNNWLRVVKPSEASFTSKFMIFHSKRKNRTVLALLKKHYEILLENKIKIDIICCPEPTVPYYEWIGYRKYARPFHHSVSPWILVPMVLVANDTEYLKKIRSPLYDPQIKSDQTLSLFLERTFSEKYSSSSAFIQLRRVGKKYNIVFKNELMKPYINVLKHHKFLNGEEVYVGSEPGSSLHMIIAGTAKTDNKVFKTGDFFGEACLLHPGKREETIIAKDGLETLELESSDFYNLINDNPETSPLILELIGERIREMNLKLTK